MINLDNASEFRYIDFCTVFVGPSYPDMLSIIHCVTSLRADRSADTTGHSLEYNDALSGTGAYGDVLLLIWDRNYCIMKL